jgi:hypothetical protein
VPVADRVRSKLHSSTYSGVEVSTEVEATHGTALSYLKDFIAHSVCKGSYRTCTDGYLCPCAVIIPPRAQPKLQTSLPSQPR